MPATRSSGAIRTTQIPSPGGMRLEFLRRVQRELDLSPDQRERIDKILKEGQDRIHKIIQPVASEFNEELQRTKDEFRAALTPEQQTRFDDLVRFQHHSHDERRQGHEREHATEATSQTNTP